MRPTATSRKPIVQLRPIDLTRFPVWEFATDEEGEEGRDETWVRPVRAKYVPANAYSLSVAARLTTPTGNEYNGLVGVNTAEGFEAVHAAVITNDRYVFIPWPGMAGASKLARDAANDLGLRATDLFPLAYRLLVPLEGEDSPREGIYHYDRSDA